MADKRQQQETSKQYTEEQFTGKLPYTLTNDFFFKAFLQRNETALRGLLCAMLSLSHVRSAKIREDYRKVKKTLHIGILDFTPKDFPQILYSDYFLYNLKTGYK